MLPVVAGVTTIASISIGSKPKRMGLLLDLAPRGLIPNYRSRSSCGDSNCGCICLGGVATDRSSCDRELNGLPHEHNLYLAIADGAGLPALFGFLGIICL